MGLERLIDKLSFGKAQEAKAARYLRAQGLRLLCRNFHSRFGEIDLIMADSGVLVFVEVRYRRGGQFGGAAASVTAAKQKKIRLTAACYLQQHPSLALNPCRFDVIGLGESCARGSHEPHIDWVRSAFE